MDEASKRFDEAILDKGRFDNLVNSVGGLDGIALVTGGFITRVGWNALVYVLSGLKETLGLIWDVIKRFDIAEIAKRFGILFDTQERFESLISIIKRFGIVEVAKRLATLLSTQKRSDDTINGATRYDEEVFDD